jgi:hypothetical protein
MQLQAAQTDAYIWLDYLSHSMSMQQLHYLFQSAIPELNHDGSDPKSLLDVGSRLGAVLYAVCSIAGVESSLVFRCAAC